MGRLHTLDEKKATLQWASGFVYSGKELCGATSIASLRVLFGDDLRRYFALAGLSRSTTAPAWMVAEALELVFRVRVLLEQRIASELNDLAKRDGIRALELGRQPIHGYSKKQGVSIRMPLSSCVPSKICGAACYAHDVLDAAPASVVRGAVNGTIATWYEEGNCSRRQELLGALERPVRRMVNAAKKDAITAAETFVRSPRIRFAHVGEFAPFPDFANDLASSVRDISNSEVTCVVYTRHPNAMLLDPDLFVVLFSLDDSSEDRSRFAPVTARKVRSAFGGKISESVDVNFLEHHRWSHIKPVGTGYVCPATEPEALLRTCDSCRCDFCFKPKPES